MSSPSYYWIAINQSSCAMCPVAVPMPIVRPRPEGLIGFPKLEDAKRAQQFCLTAPISEVAEAVRGWQEGVDGAVVVIFENPEPPGANTAWVVRK